MNCFDIGWLFYSLFKVIAALALLYFGKLHKLILIFPIGDVVDQLIWICKCLKLFNRLSMAFHRILDP